MTYACGGAEVLKSYTAAGEACYATCAVNGKQLSNSKFPALDFESFKQQETTFVVLNLFILATLLLVHSLFASYWGFPSAPLIAILSAASIIQGTELFWLAFRSQRLGRDAMMILTWAGIAFNVVIAVLLQAVTNREDTQYFVILIVPVLIAAFRLTLIPTLLVVTVVDGVSFFWVWHYAQHQLLTPLNEYFEAGTVSLIFTVVGVLVWLLVNHLHHRETRLSESLAALEKTRELLVQEERLAAIGRLASGVAHEIRNPVSAIASALATARGSGLDASERDEMFEIAAKESTRLERLTTDFLSYARPRHPQKSPTPLDDILGHVADACRPRGHAGVNIVVHPCPGLIADIDSGYVQQALVDLLVNAMEAASPAGRVDLRAGTKSDGSVWIDIANTGPDIVPASAARIFEPFFTTKPQGTGLGLAIARNIARAHGGDLILSANEPGRVCFTLRLPGERE